MTFGINSWSGLQVTPSAMPAAGVNKEKQASPCRSPGQSRRPQRGGNRWQQLQKHAWHVSSSPPNSNSSGPDTSCWLLCKLSPALPCQRHGLAARCCLPACLPPLNAPLTLTATHIAALGLALKFHNSCCQNLLVQISGLSLRPMLSIVCPVLLSTLRTLDTP